jgi:hypothetical protein
LSNVSAKLVTVNETVKKSYSMNWSDRRTSAL